MKCRHRFVSEKNGLVYCSEPEHYRAQSCFCYCPPMYQGQVPNCPIKAGQTSLEAFAAVESDAGGRI